MATKENLKQLSGIVKSEINDVSQYSSLDLNQPQKCSDVFSAQIYSKSSTINKKFDNALTDDCPKNLKLWNKSTKNQPLKILCALNFYDESEKDAKKCWKDNNSNFSANSSTLSLHIAAYENSFEHSNEQCKDSSIKIKEAKQFGFSSELQNLFEFPRQMEDNESRTPQVMQFKASQKLLNPNEVVPEKSDLVDSGNAETEAKENPEGAAGIAITSSSATSTTSNMASNEYTLEKAFASLPRTVRGLPLVISGDPNGTKFLYCNGNNVYIREIDDPTKVEIYSEHAQLTTVAKYSPSGYYIASGDQSGKLRIWDTTQTTHILKAEYAFIAGAIRDIAWNDDSKRLAIVGEGRDRFGHVFLFDTGTSNGNLSGQSRVMTSIDFKPSRPYRLVSGSEDNTVAIFEGPPFKFKTLFHNHTRFVNSVRYNKDGSLFASAGADGKVFLCDGVEGEKKGELIDSSVKGGAAHAGGVFALAWNSDGSKLVSVSGDKTLKIWSATDQSLLKTVTFGDAIEDQQLAVTWQKDTIVSIGLSGFIFYINPESGEITKTIRGHNKPITALALSPDKKYAFTADFEGHITRWQISDGTSERLTPQIHKSQVASLAVTSKGTLVSIGWDDTVAFTAGVFEKVENIQANSQRLSSQPRGLDVSPDGSIAVVVCQREIVIFKNEKQAGTVNIKYEAQCGAYQSDGKYLAVGGSDNKVHVYSIQDVNLTEKQALPHAGCITSVSFSNDGKYLVATDNNRKVIPYKVDDNFSVASEKDWTYHNARVNCGAWSPNGRYVATGGLDTNVIVWDIQHSGESPIEIRGAHSSSAINGVAWLDDKRLLTVGQDSNIKIWSVNLS